MRLPFVRHLLFAYIGCSVSLKTFKCSLKFFAKSDSDTVNEYEISESEKSKIRCEKYTVNINIIRWK